MLAFTHDGATLAVLATTTAESGFIEVPISRLVQPQGEAKPTAESYKHAMSMGPKWKGAIGRRIKTATENGAVGVGSSSSSSSSSGGGVGMRAALAERRKEQQAKMAQEAAEVAAASKAKAKAAAAAKHAAVPKAAKPAKATGGENAAPAFRTDADVRRVFYSANQCLKSQKKAEVDAAVAITFKGRDLAEVRGLNLPSRRERLAVALGFSLAETGKTGKTRKTGESALKAVDVGGGDSGESEDE